MPMALSTLRASGLYFDSCQICHSKASVSSWYFWASSRATESQGEVVGGEKWRHVAWPRSPKVGGVVGAGGSGAWVGSTEFKDREKWFSSSPPARLAMTHERTRQK